MLYIVLDINVPEDLCTEDVNNFTSKAVECVELYAKKNHDYGNSFEKDCDDIGQAYAIGRIYDKVNRLVNVTKLKVRLKMNL